VTATRKRAVAVGGAVFALVVVWAFVGDHVLGTSRDPDQPVVEEHGAYADDAREFLGIAAGDDVAGWKLRWGAGPDDAAVTLRFERGRTRMSVWYRRLDPDIEAPPPRRTQYFDLFYGHIVRDDPDAPDEVVEREQLLDELTRRLIGAESSKPPPLGL
jgi:hypothetical protein